MKVAVIVRRQAPAIGAWMLLAASFLCGCDRCTRKPDGHSSAGSAGSTAIEGASAPRPSAVKSATTRAPPPPTAPAASSEQDEPPHAGDARAAGDGPYLMDQVADVGPAGPATADARGVVMVTRDGAIVIAKLDTGAKSARSGRHAGRRAGRHAIPTPITPVAAAAGAFVARARGPALLRGVAYWIHDGRLLGRPLGGAGKGGLEVLARDARDATRVASATVEPVTDPPAVAYIARGTGGLVARLWVEGSGVIDLSPDAAGANSVALARTGSGLVAVSLAGHTAMTPVHARRIDFEGRKPKLGQDTVVWVAGPSQPLTELSAVGTPDGDLWAFVPLERDITRFGLARIHVGAKPTMDARVIWRSFPNGLDPAPLATALVCGKAVVLYARPVEATPHAAQELLLAALGGDRLGRPVVIARAGAFMDVSIAALAHGALVAYVADHRTWARSLRCRSRR